MTFSRQIAARIREKERQKEAARQAAIDAALAKPPPPGVTKDNWSHWHRHGWIVCPATRDLTCSDSACGIGGKCNRLAEIGLAGDGSPLRRKDRPRCGAWTQTGAPCLVLLRLPLPRRALNRPQDRRGQGADRSGAAPAVG